MGHLGNVAIAAAMAAAPIEHSSMDHFSKALGMAMFVEKTYHRHVHDYFDKAVQVMYEKQKESVLEEILKRKEPVDICIDGRYDSVGYSAEMAVESVLEVSTGRVITFAVTHKSEVDGKSSCMELKGAKKVGGIG